MVADKGPNGPNGPKGLNPNGLKGPIGPNGLNPLFAHPSLRHTFYLATTSSTNTSCSAVGSSSNI